MNVQQLMDAVSQLDAHDALQCKLTLDEWKALAPYLSMRFLLRYLATHRLDVFAWYRLALAAAVWLWVR